MLQATLLHNMDYMYIYLVTTVILTNSILDWRGNCSQQETEACPRSLTAKKLMSRAPPPPPHVLMTVVFVNAPLQN